MTQRILTVVLELLSAVGASEDNKRGICLSLTFWNKTDGLLCNDDSRNPMG